MKDIGKVMVAAAVILGLYALGMDTTVLSESGDRVHNFGLMQRQNTLLWVAGVAVVTGVILLLKDRPQPEDVQQGGIHEKAQVIEQYAQALRLIRADDADGLRALLRQNDAAIQGEDAQRQTLLHHAAAKQSLDCVCVLLKYGASPSRFDAAGKLPEDYATTEGPGLTVRTVLRAAV